MYCIPTWLIFTFWPTRRSLVIYPVKTGKGRERRRENVSISALTFPFGDSCSLFDQVEAVVNFLLGNAHSTLPPHSPLKRGFLTYFQFFVLRRIMLENHLLPEDEVPGGLQGGKESCPCSHSPSADCLNAWLGLNLDFPFIVSGCSSFLPAFLPS